MFRHEHGRIIAGLIRLCGSFDRAEEAMQDALTAALRHWPDRGIPQNPAAWIMTAAHRKLIDMARRERTRNEKHDLLEREVAIAQLLEPIKESLRKQEEQAQSIVREHRESAGKITGQIENLVKVQDLLQRETRNLSTALRRPATLPICCPARAPPTPATAR